MLSYCFHFYALIISLFSTCFLVPSAHSAAITGGAPSPIEKDPNFPYLNCIDEPQLPRLADCLALVEILRVATKKPGENVEKNWGRSQLDLPKGRTAHLPKKYWIGKFDPTRGASSCMLYLDDNPRQGFPDYDRFRLENIVHAGERLTTRCLIDQRQGGFDYPGTNGTVYVHLTQYSPYTDGVAGGTNESSHLGNAIALTTEVVGNETLTLYEQSLPETVRQTQVS